MTIRNNVTKDMYETGSEIQKDLHAIKRTIYE